MTPPDISRRLGRTFLPDLSLTDADAQDALLAISARCIVVRAESLFHKKGVEQIAMSPDYDEVRPGTAVPDYEWLVERDDDGAIVRVWARRTP